MYLCGHPGPLRRQIVLALAQTCGMEVEYLPISRDTTESDIKQRKEIKGSSSNLDPAFIASLTLFLTHRRFSNLL